MKQYHFAKDINNTGQTGIVEVKTMKLLCLCTEENATIILKSFDLCKKTLDHVKSRLNQEVIPSPSLNSLGVLASEIICD